MKITAFYQFFPVADTTALQSELFAKGETLDMQGLVLVASEGINGTVSGSPESIETFKQYIHTLHPEVVFKDSEAQDHPFKRWFVKIRTEIVALGDTDIVPEDLNDETHIPPAEWNRMMDEEDVVVLDTRNDYETEIGVFEGALDPNLKQFNEFPEWVEECDIPKDKKVLMYCTGGIRCEKACLEMKRQGYKNVYQLKGGILQYLKECPNEKFKGECFVFDHRTAVDQELNPSEQYALCPHTGDPGDQRIDCVWCGEMAKVAKHCTEHQKKCCSKNCSEMLRRYEAKEIKKAPAAKQ